MDNSNYLLQGLKLPQELADRIEVRDNKAFLLPSKEDDKLITTYGDESILTTRTYTIEEIEKAIDKINCNLLVKALFKNDLINNLKK